MTVEKRRYHYASQGKTAFRRERGGGVGKKREKWSFSDRLEERERGEGGGTDLSVDQEPKVARVQGLLLEV